jgi:hypothetical protein
MTVPLIHRRSRGGQCCSYRCHELADGGSVWIVIRIGFDQGHANDSGGRLQES